MPELLCFTPDRFWSWNLPAEDGMLQAQVEGQTVKVPLGHSRIVGETVCYARQSPDPDSLSLLMPSDGLIFGRSLMEDPDPSVSGQHFRLIRQADTYLLEDLDSMNGTYINGRRVKREALHFLDRIQCARCSLLWVGSFFLCSFRQHGPSPPQRPARERFTPDVSQSWKDLPEWAQIPKRMELSLETWSLQETPAKQNLFLSCGSSLLMCAGSLLSAAMLQFSGAGSAESVQTSLVMSLSMAGSFLIYGIVSRKLTHRQALREIQGREQAYRQYLNQLQDQIRQLRQEIEQGQQRLSALWSSLDPVLYRSGLPIPAGWQETETLCGFSMPSFSWQHRQHPLFREVQEVIREAALPLRTLRYEDLEGPASGCLRSLFAMTVWSRDPEQVKWGGPVPVKGEWPHLWHDRQPVKTVIPGLSVYGLSIREEAGLPCSLHNLERLQMMPPLTEEQVPAARSGPEYRVQIGTAQDHQPVCLDLIADGPHGLVAGTTGSGKSEAMATLLCQLALCNDPVWFQFVILDFKGGSFAAPFADLPHCAGILTDLEEDSMESLQLTLEGELKRREERMRRFQENHPLETPDFQTFNRFEEDPMPLLLVVADEFAQIREQHPLQMDFLQSLARVGRSLGICLLLSTQRPQGVVDAQILANTGYILCFRVRDRFESQEVLQNGRAAALKGAGDGWFGQIRFQALYARRPVGKTGYLMDEQGRVIRQLEQTTWLETALQTASKHRAGCKPLLLSQPGPFEGPGLAQVLDAARSRLYILDPPAGSCTRILAPDCSRQVVKALQGLYPGLYLPGPGSAWFARHLDQERTVVLIDQDPEDWRLPEIRLFVIQTRPRDWSAPADWTVMFGAASSLCSFGSIHQDCPFPKGRLEEGNFPLWMQADKPAAPAGWLPDFSRPESWESIFESPVLGISSREPVFWNGEPLKILGSEAQKTAERLARWRPDYPAPQLEDSQLSEGMILYTTGWKQDAWKLGLPAASGPWLLWQNGQFLDLEPLIYAD